MSAHCAIKLSVPDCNSKRSIVEISLLDCPAAQCHIGRMNNEDRHRLLVRITESLTSTMYSLEGDPDEEPTPLSMGSILADVALGTIEQSGFEIVRKR